MQASLLDSMWRAVSGVLLTIQSELPLFETATRQHTTVQYSSPTTSSESTDSTQLSYPRRFGHALYRDLAEPGWP
jgi:hypothetical protein